MNINQLSDNVQKFEVKAGMLKWVAAACSPNSAPTIYGIARHLSLIEYSRKEGITIDQAKAISGHNEKIQKIINRGMLKWDKRWYRWKKDPLFMPWYMDEFKRMMGENEIYLDKVGMMKSASDFRYWEAMQMKYAGFSRKEDVRNTNVNPQIHHHMSDVNNIDDIMKKYDVENRATETYKKKSKTTKVPVG